MDREKPAVDYIRLLRRVVAYRWRIALTVFLAIAVPTLVWTIVGTDDTYETSATLFLLPEKSEPSFMKELISPEVSGLYQAILRSRSLAQGVVEALPKESRDELSRRLGFRDYVLVAMNQIRRWRGMEVVVHSPTELAVRELQDARMTFNIAKDSTVTISATAFSPRVAVDLANTYVEVLLSRSSAFARQQARGTRELVENLLTQTRTSQAEAEDSLRQFQAQRGAVKLPEESRVDLQRVAQLESSMSDVQVSREIAQGRLAYLKGDGKANSQGVMDANIQPLRERYSRLEAKLAGLKEKYNEQHPLMQATQAELQEAQERLKASLQTQQTPRPGGALAVLKPLENAQLSKQMAELEVEILSLKIKEDALRQRIARVKGSMFVMGAREYEYAGLARTAETQTKLVTSLADKLTAARLQEQSQIRGIQIIDPASLPRQPSAKQPMKLILLGLIGGLGLGFAAAVLREFASQVVETEQDAAWATDLPVLGSIPTAPTSPGDPSTEHVPTVFVATHEPHALPADACRAIRTAIDCHNLERPMKTLIVTSAGAHEGKSTVLLNLGLSFAEAGRRVLLIDGDLRRPSLHRGLRVPNEKGLADLLKGNTVWPEGVRRITPEVNFLPSGMKIPNPGSLLGSPQMIKLLALAREQTDLILIDSPPVLAVSDCLPLTAQVDGVLLVSRFGVTPRRNLARAKHLLEKAGARLVGVIVNGLSARETRAQYSEYSSYTDREPTGGKRKRRTVKALFTRVFLAVSLLGATATTAMAADDYTIGTEDVLQIMVWDNKDLDQTVTVRPDGRISYPLAGEIQAQGLTVPQLTEILKERLSGPVKNPNVSVMVKEIRSYRVHMLGKVLKPGVYPIKTGTPLLQALTLAGGTSENADLPAAYIIRGDQKLPIDLRKLIQDGDLSKNVKLQSEDTVVVPEISTGGNPQEVLERRIYVLGEVAKPGVYTLKQDVPILHALFLAGGVSKGGDLASAFVIRGGDKIPVDLWKLIQKGDVAQNVMIKHEDTIVVPSGGELQNAVYVMGEVTKPGVYSQPEALSLLKLVSLAGGFTKFAAPGRATLIRRDGDKKVLMKIDLKDIMNDPKANEDLSLLPGDVLIVPERLF